MLELGKEGEKIKAMREVIKDMASGRDVSALFPNVVKLVAAKSLEVCSKARRVEMEREVSVGVISDFFPSNRSMQFIFSRCSSPYPPPPPFRRMQLRKLAYMFVVRYAEEVPDIALLSISSFQKGMKVRYTKE